MHTTEQLLDQVKATHGLSSDYALAKRWGISTQRVSKYRNGLDTLGAEMAMLAAADLGLDPGYVLACMAAERAKRPPEKKAWERVAKRMAHAAIFLLCLGVTYYFGWDLDTAAQALFVTGGYTHYATSPSAWLFALALIVRALQRVPKRP